ncbi:MAG: HemK2/MTQ2 family protein methyltransferase [Candidatus Helarchaeota archaeon]
MEYLGLKFEILDQVYEPCDDSFLFAENLEINKGDFVLEVGTGCGLLSIIAAARGAHVISIDISPIAIKCALKNSRLNKVENRINFLVGNLLNPLIPYCFDVIIFNPPYLPGTCDKSDLLAKSWSGGEKGNEIILEFLEMVDNYVHLKSRILIIISSLSRPKEIFETIKNKSMEFKILKEEKYFFEKIMLIEIKKNQEVLI